MPSAPFTEEDRCLSLSYEEGCRFSKKFMTVRITAIRIRSDSCGGSARNSDATNSPNVVCLSAPFKEVCALDGACVSIRFVIDVVFDEDGGVGEIESVVDDVVRPLRRWPVDGGAGMDVMNSSKTD